MAASALVRLAPSVPRSGAVALTPPPHRWIFVDADARLVELDLATRRLRALEPAPAVEPWLREQRAVAMGISLDSATWVFESEAGLLAVRVATSNPTQVSASKSSRIRLLSIHPSGETLFAIARQGPAPWIRAIDVHHGTTLYELPARVGAVSRCGRFVAAAIEQDFQTSTLSVFEDGRLVARVTRPHTAELLVFAADPGVLWGYDRTGELYWFDVRRSVLAPVAHRHRDVCALIPHARDTSVWIEAPRGTLHRVEAAPVEAVTEEAPNAQRVKPIGAPPDRRVTQSPDGQVAVTRGGDGVRVIDACAGSAVQIARAPVAALAMAAQRRQLCAAQGSVISLLDACALSVLGRFEIGPSDVSDVAFSADESLLFAIDAGGELAAWGVEDGREEWRLALESRDLEAGASAKLSRSACGRWLAVRIDARDRWHSYLVDVVAREVRSLEGLATFATAGDAPRAVVLSATAGEVLVHEIDPKGVLVGEAESYRDPVRDVDDDVVDVLLASASGRFIVGRTAEWNRGFLIDRRSRTVRKLPGQSMTMTQAQLWNDAWIMVSARSHELHLVAHDLEDLSVRRRAKHLVLVDEPTALAFVAAAVFIGDARGAVARYDVDPR